MRYPYHFFSVLCEFNSHFSTKPLWVTRKPLSLEKAGHFSILSISKHICISPQMYEDIIDVILGALNPEKCLALLQGTILWLTIVIMTHKTCLPTIVGWRVIQKIVVASVCNSKRMLIKFKEAFGIVNWLRGAMVARLTPDQKVACSNHVGVNSII